jgi:hypothetical protein
MSMIGLPSHGEEAFLNIAVAVIVALVLLTIVVTLVRRRRQGSGGSWWKGPNPEKDRVRIYSGRRDQ